MELDQLMKFGAYEKSRRLFEMAADDMEVVAKNPLCERMVSGQMAGADSFCANIEEGYGRESSREYRKHLIIARGSAREARGRYLRFGRWLSAERVAPRVELCEEIIPILSATVRRLEER